VLYVISMPRTPPATSESTARTACSADGARSTADPRLF